VALPETVDEVRVVSTREDFALTVDRRRGLYWVRDGREYDDGEEHGYYVTNPSLAMVLDRFVSESIWPLARPLFGESRRPSLPKRYLRIRDCLADVATLTESRSTDSFEVEFEGYDTETGEEVCERGTLTSYYYTEYDVRASLTLDLDGAPKGVESSLVTVGGVGTRNVDYAAFSIELRESDARSDRLDGETERHLAACRAELPAELGDGSVVGGFDAFVDRMRELVERRPGAGYERVRQFDALREALVRFEASETAPRLQWRQTRTEPGGHVAHLGGVFDELGYDLTLVGRLGDPIRAEFASRFRDQRLVSVGDTTSTEFVWFEDRKFLLTEPNQETLDWARIEERVEPTDLAEYVDGASLVSLASWFGTPELPDVLDGLRRELWPLLNSPPPHVHLSPGEVEPFAPEEIEAGRDSIAALDDVVPVTLTANRSQTRRFRDVLVGDDGGSAEPTVERVRDRLGVTRYVMHSRRGATLASPDGVVSARAPAVVNPRRLRNVDEHFNSGMALALAEGLSDGAALVLANSVASYFMRHKKAPDSDELRAFVAEYDELFPGHE
jgi:hypothetical protein